MVMAKRTANLLMLAFVAFLFLEENMVSSSSVDTSIRLEGGSQATLDLLYLDEKLFPDQEVCLKIGADHYNVTIHCSCGSVCHLYGDCCREDVVVCDSGADDGSSIGRFKRAASIGIGIGIGIPDNGGIGIGIPTNEKRNDHNMTTERVSGETTQLMTSTAATIGNNEDDSSDRCEFPVGVVTLNSIAHRLALRCGSCKALPLIKRYNTAPRDAHKTNVPHVHLVDRCPATFVNEKVVKKCEDLIDILPIKDVDNLPRIIPVTDSNTNITFQNQFCAACHGIQDFITWNLYVICKEEAYDPFLPCSSLQCVIDMLLGDNKCQIEPRPARMQDARYCFPELPRESDETCRTKGLDDKARESLLQHCMSYTNVVRVVEKSLSTKYFRNYHCLRCIEYSPLLIVAGENCTTDGFPGLGLDTYSFGAVLNMGSAWKQGEGNSDSKCPTGQTYLPAVSECRPLLVDVYKVHYPMLLNAVTLSLFRWKSFGLSYVNLLEPFFSKYGAKVSIPSFMLLSGRKYEGGLHTVLPVLVHFPSLVFADYQEGEREVLCLQEKIMADLDYETIDGEYGRAVFLRNETRSPLCLSSVTDNGEETENTTFLEIGMPNETVHNNGNSPLRLFTLNEMVPIAFIFFVIFMAGLTFY